LWRPGPLGERAQLHGERRVWQLRVAVEQRLEHDRGKIRERERGERESTSRGRGPPARQLARERDQSEQQRRRQHNVHRGCFAPIGRP